jgi:putative RNA 2'-phosphotransferase
MDDKRRIKVSKYLSKHLRHEPGRLGLELQDGGWVDVEALLRACAAHHFPLSRAELEEVVETSEKQRFAIDPAADRIRANQGHSVAVDLRLPEVEPPPILYHGTGRGNAESIRRGGLLKRKRHHVHLSSDFATAVKVGTRHGKPVVFAVDAAALRQGGVPFYRSVNGVWLVEHVPAEYLREIEEQPS